MSRWILCALIAGGIACRTAAGVTNIIVQHNSHLREGTHYSVSQAEKKVTIILGVAGETFEFEAKLMEGDVYQGPGNISSIMALDDAGAVMLTVIGHDGHEFGASDIGEIRLQKTGVTGTISELTIEHDFGAVGPMEALAAGTLSIGRDVLDTMFIAQNIAALSIGGGLLADVFADNIYGPVSVGTLSGMINAAVVTGPVQFGTMTDETYALFWITDLGTTLSVTGVGPHAGTIDIQAFDDPSNAITVTGDFAGLIVFGEGICPPPAMLGNVTVTGDLTDGAVHVHGLYEGQINVGGLLGASHISLTGIATGISSVHVRGGISSASYVAVGGDLRGALQVDGLVDAGGGGVPRIQIGWPEYPANLSGSLALNGGLSGAVLIKGDIEAGALFEITNGMTSTASVTVESDTLGTLHVIGDAAGTMTTGDIGEQATVQIDGDWGGVATTKDVLGTCAVNGHVLTSDEAGIVIDGDIGSAAAAGHVSVGVATGGLSACLTASGSVANLGLLEIDGPMDSGGRIFVGSGVLGSIEVNGDVSADAAPDTPRIAVQGALTGQVLVARQNETDGLNGTLEVTGTVNNSGLVRVEGDLGAAAVIRVPELLGAIQIDGTSAGTIEVLSDIGRDRSSGSPAISVGQNLTGEIRVYGSMYDIPGVPYEIRIGDRMPFPGAFVVDYDGYDDADEWDPNAAVFVQHSNPNDPNSASKTYYGNDPAARVYRVAKCVGDMNGDGKVGFGDINPFVAAQNGLAQYAGMEPGLEGSMVYHGDCNGDGSFGFGDINPFIALVTTGRCGLGTDDDRGAGAEMVMYEGAEGVPDQLPPEELAAVLAANVAPELFDSLLFMVLGAIDSAPDEETQAYWQAVYAALTQ